ncbi:unnamed protein product [Clonostachys byssicola]|uniref:Uncharacterized protein n=1 Tax=Clonostachys byssicola TaxID=160290 RepID=A0A9N9Y821_9HYPO|nr:unnamed protein product [Clonostachys byssicola]
MEEEAGKPHGGHFYAKNHMVITPNLFQTTTY